MLLDLLAPPLCWSCRAPAARGSALCRDCRGSLRFLAAPADPPPGTPGTPAGAPALHPWAAVAYEGPARDLVRALKFHGATAIAGEMAAVMVANAPPALLVGVDALVPVPLHPARLRARGFNQAALIASAVGERTGLPVADVLLRSGPATRQVGRDRAARLSGPPGEIRVTGRHSPAPPPLAPPPLAPAPRAPPTAALLVDDVVTTGATLSACAAALRGAGSVPVAAVAFARTAGR